VDGGEGWEETVHMPSCFTHITEEPFKFVKRTLIYLAVSMIRGRRGRGSVGREGGGGTGGRAR